MADVTFVGKTVRHVIGDLVFKRFKFNVNGSMTLPTGQKQLLTVLPYGALPSSGNAYSISAVDTVTGIITVSVGGPVTDQEITVISRVG